VIRDLITEGQADGLTAQRACEVIGLSQRTFQRWQVSTASRPSTPDATVAPALTLPALARRTPLRGVVLRPRPYNALTVSEATTVVALIQSAQHADASCRELALALQNGPFPTYVSHVTVWEYQRALNCNGPRGRQVAQGQHRTAPDTDWVNGPNLLWDWDITYLYTLERGVFLYLYSLLDHWSRKNIAWLIGTQLSSALVQTLWDHGLINEGLLDQPATTWPKSLSDRGAQMRSRSTATYFKKLGIEQLFSRPRTPNDNPYIESHFATIKTQPVFPGFFADPPVAESYFSQFYLWYNDVHPHTRLHMFTPNQVHSGQGPRLLAERAALKAVTFAARIADPDTRTFTLEELIAHHLPDVSDYPCYTWAGPKTAPAKRATPFD
jgi:transposase InsO family protein